MVRTGTKSRYRYGGLTTKFPSEYGSYLQMIDRCTNSNHKSWLNYGGRGIKVCIRWLKSFALFLEDMGQKPTSKHTLERKDNDGNYTPKNCCWATMRQQARNRRANTIITYQNKSLCLAEWSDITGIHVNVLIERLSKGWSEEKTLLTNPRDYFTNRPAELFTLNGVTKPLIKWAEEFGISIQALKGRVKRGWSALKALTTPVRKTKQYQHWKSGQLTHQGNSLTEQRQTRK